MIEHILSPDLTHALGWTLVHALWQGAAFALLLGVLLLVLRRYSAKARYVVAVGLLACFFIGVVATFVRGYQQGLSEPIV
ncbi:MAG: peptidase, partial [Bacteroidota bacterium]